ncbi:FtsQ-type POTRA domain-containing protein [Gordonia sp. ABSL1-1]|uniref:cell division protein FtsQ/DivIB n=1 Tax=Gordonia sp. ABSL1-1 TaxID=3053923 RepID=UPI002573EE9D|nr:FtsQ-type POTRA domain-containing protein [Gordonia sp. ABSL1-1]MDL9937408.1 FtsQ-type POTRA domain-containing protein [Gordonia sp. ABSL1-1]
MRRPHLPDRLSGRGRWLGGAVLLVAVVVGLGLIAYLTPLMSVRSTEVDGVHTIAEDEVLRVADVASGTPLLQVDTSAVAQRVAAIPAVETVRVQRSYPSTLVITVVERVPLVIRHDGDNVLVLDRGGVTYMHFDRRGGVPPEILKLPAFETPDPGPADPSTLAALKVVGELPEPLAQQLEKISANSPVDITLTLKGNRTVVWGGSDRTADKARTLTALLTRKAKNYNVSSPEFPAYR